MRKFFLLVIVFMAVWGFSSCDTRGGVSRDLIGSWDFVESTDSDFNDSVDTLLMAIFPDDTFTWNYDGDLGDENFEGTIVGNSWDKTITLHFDDDALEDWDGLYVYEISWGTLTLTHKSAEVFTFQQK